MRKIIILTFVIVVLSSALFAMRQPMKCYLLKDMYFDHAVGNVYIEKNDVEAQQIIINSFLRPKHAFSKSLVTCKILNLKIIWVYLISWRTVRVSIN
jgi:hypothetical protein